MKRNGKLAVVGAVLAALIGVSCDTGTMPPVAAEDTVLNQSIAAYNNNASAVSRGTMPDTEKTAIISAFTDAINGADPWYKGRIFDGAFVLKLYVENGSGAAGTETDGMHRTPEQAKAMTPADITAFMISRGHKKPLEAGDTKLMNESLNGGRVVVSSSAVMSDADKTLVKNNIEAAVAGAAWHLAHMTAEGYVLAVSVNNGGTNLTDGWVMTEAAAKALTAQQVKDWLEANVTAFQSGNYTTDGWTIYYRVPMDAAQKGYVDQAIANLGWYKTNAQSYNNFYVNNGPDDLNDGGNGAVITGNPTNQSVVQNAIISFLNGKNINEPTGPTYDTFTLLNDRTNIDIKYDNRINFNTSEKIKIRDAYDFIVNNFSFNGKTVKLFVERDGTPTSVVANGIHVAYEWLQQNHADELGILFNQWINMSETARAMPQKQDNLKIMLGNAVLASVMDRKLFMGDVFNAVANPAERKKIAPNKRGGDSHQIYG
jgi:hypothetical protein